MRSVEVLWKAKLEAAGRGEKEGEAEGEHCAAASSLKVLGDLGSFGAAIAPRAASLSQAYPFSLIGSLKQ
jgi:hypothetical protein